MRIDIEGAKDLDTIHGEYDDLLTLAITWEKHVDLHQGTDHISLDKEQIKELIKVFKRFLKD